MATKQAFVIMQIGNKELEKIYDDVIESAIKSCQLIPRRVDKHNEGGLLKSEIIKFIKSSDIIIADLTNARPNCYLEIGYTMGLGKFKNLILTVKEDHNRDSPNYKGGNKRVHFDLLGYDILFWDPNKLADFKLNLEKRIQSRIFKIRSTKDENIWDKDWIMKRRKEALTEMKKNEKLGFVEINTTLTNPENNKFECEKLKKTFENTFMNNNQWPIGYLNKLINIYPKNDGIFFEIKDHLLDNLYLYGYIREDGTFYLIHSLFEDAKKYFEYISCELRIDRIVKALLFSIQFYQNLNIKPNSYLVVGIKHGGLKDRCIVRGLVNVRFHDPTPISNEDESYYEETLILNKIEEQLSEIVERFSNKLFKLFNFYQLDKKYIDEIVKKVIS